MSYSPLVATAALADHLSDPNWVVFDCRHDLMDPARGRQVYAQGHLPGARFAAVDQDLSGVKTGRNGRHPLPRPEAFAAFLAASGVRSGCRLVAYDDVGGQYAARFWWLCRWIGWEDVAVLDGGLPRWEQEGRALEREVPRPEPGRVEVALRPELLATVEQVAALVAGGPGIVVDARVAERFRGEVEPLDPVAGHIPGARNVVFSSNLHADLTFRPKDELADHWHDVLGEKPATDVVHQCGSGITACVNLLAMEVAGLPGSRLYAGSWSEWVADSVRPVARGDQ